MMYSLSISYLKLLYALITTDPSSPAHLQYHFISCSLSLSLSPPPLSSPSLLHAHSLCLFFSFLLSLLHTLSHSLFLSFTLFISPSEYKKTSPFTHLLGALRKSAMKDLVLSTLICQVSSISNFCIILGSFFFFCKHYYFPFVCSFFF